MRSGQIRRYRSSTPPPVSQAWSPSTTSPAWPSARLDGGTMISACATDVASPQQPGRHVAPQAQDALDHRHEPAVVTTVPGGRQ